MATPLTEKNMAICLSCQSCVNGGRCRYFRGGPFRVKFELPKFSWANWYAIRGKSLQIRRAKYKKANPLEAITKERAYSKKHQYLKNKPDACSNCGKLTERLEPHHENYHAPTDVKWLCRSCHRKLHRSGLPLFQPEGR